MASYLPAKISSSGQLMLMQDMEGKVDIQFTRIAFGDGVYSEEEYSKITSRANLKSEKQSSPINAMKILSKNSLLLSAVVSNEDLTDGYRITEIGIFAKDTKNSASSEILYAIVVAEEGREDYMPAYNGTTPVRIRQNFQIDIVDASQTTIAVEDNSVVVAQSFLEEFYYNKTATDEKFEECMKYELVTLASYSDLSKISEVDDKIYLARIHPGVINGLDYAVSAHIFSYSTGNQILITQNGQIFSRYYANTTVGWMDFMRCNSTDFPDTYTVNGSVITMTSENAYNLGEYLNTKVHSGRVVIIGNDGVDYVDVVYGGGFTIQTRHKFDGSIAVRTRVDTTWTNWNYIVTVSSGE